MPRKKKTVTPYEKEELKVIHQIASKMTVPVEITESLEDLLEELTKDKFKLMPIFLRAFKLIYYSKNCPWLDPEGKWEFKRGAYRLLHHAINCFKDGKEMSKEVTDLISDIFCRAFRAREPLDSTLHYDIMSHTLKEYIQKHVESDTVQSMKVMMGVLLREVNDEDVDELLYDTYSRYVVTWLRDNKPSQVLLPYIDLVIDVFLQHPETYQAYLIGYIIDGSEHGISQKTFDHAYEVFLEIDQEEHITSLFGSACKKCPRVMVKHVNSYLEYVTSEEKDMDGDHLYLAISCIQPVTEKWPSAFDKRFIDWVIMNKKIKSYAAYYIKEWAVFIGIGNKNLCQDIFDALLARCKMDKEDMNKYFFVDGLRCLAGNSSLNMLKPHRAYFEKLKNESIHEELTKCVTNILLAFDGKSLDFILVDLDQLKQNLKELDERVEENENATDELQRYVDRQDEEMGDVLENMAGVKDRVENVEQHAGDIRDKVEDIEAKLAMSHAPKWSRDLTKLMNLKADKDWKLLAKELDYTNDDIRAWTTYEDPCMALLAEFYNNENSARDGNQRMLTALIKMERLDAALVMENAMKNVGEEIEEDFEYTSPPPIFLSYDWENFEHVKVLRDHLQQAGYECWMDEGRMGGGNQLIGKIDRGIRGSKVILACVTDAYTRSPNGLREMNLVTTLGKPMIPLLMDKMSWPPKGSMGVMLSEYLFVRFFTRDGEEMGDERYWAEPKFHEMLMQLNIYKCLPDELNVAADYKNWWKPIAPKIVIKKRKDAPSFTNNQQPSKSKEINKSPDIFLSYQWGKQPKIKALYKKLTEMGFTCWMDIYQMGGGDSLYDKIDRGVRGCRVVVTMVTSKYALSANCRREVSLSDSIKKPMIPVLMEQIDWPPQGPMNKVFKNKNYIDISYYLNYDCTDEVEDTWDKEEFDTLVSKIIDIAPDLLYLVKEEEEEEVIPEQNRGQTVSVNHQYKNSEQQQIGEQQELLKQQQQQQYQQNQQFQQQNPQYQQQNPQYQQHNPQYQQQNQQQNQQYQQQNPQYQQHYQPQQQAYQTASQPTYTNQGQGNQAYQQVQPKEQKSSSCSLL